jgi:hypothetical protein
MRNGKLQELMKLLKPQYKTDCQELDMELDLVIGFTEHLHLITTNNDNRLIYIQLQQVLCLLFCHH